MSAALALPPSPAIDHDPAPDLLGSWLRKFEEADMSSRESREMANKARDYFDGRQFTPEEIAELERRRQPPTVNNKIRPKVQMLMGLERRGRSDPKAFPRTPTEDNRADAATQMLRYIADQNRFDVIRSAVYENMLIEGVGGCEVIIEAQAQSQQALMGSTALTPQQPDYDVTLNHIPYERLFYDPHSSHPGFSDAQYLGVVIWMDRDEALAVYPNCEALLDATFSDTGSTDSFTDRPGVVWADARRRRIRMVQMHCKRGHEWWTGTFTKGGFVEGPDRSPYVDRHGDPTCPLILRACFTDRDNNRYGMVRDLIPLQDAVNKRESKLLHALNVNQIIMEQGAVDDVDDARREAAKPDGVIQRNRGFEFEIRKDQAEITGHFNLLQYSIGQMNGQGPNANMQGKDPRDQSGRAIIAQQTGGIVEAEPLADNLRQWTHKVWEAAWNRTRQFVTRERWVRVTDNDRNVRFVGLNREVTLADMLGDLDHTAPLPQQLQGMDQDDQHAIMFGLQLQPGDPRLQMVVKVENDVSDMDVDITVEEGPDNPTMQAEQFQMLMQLPPQILGQFPPNVIIQASSLRNKEELLKALEEHQQATAQEAQQAKASAMALQQATVADKTAQAADKQASAVVKLHGVAMDHAHTQDVPVVPGIGPVQPEMNPLLQPEPPQPGV